MKKLKGFLSNQLPLVMAVGFFIVLFATLNDYGISWDEPIHFYRGEAYFHYFLTGHLTYDDLPKVYNFQGTFGDPENIPAPRRSVYQNDFFSGNYFLQNDSGHPPINGELAALGSFIFYQKLGWMSDVNSHQLFILTTSGLLIFIVVQLTLEYFGLLPAIISGLALASYPLFFSESHFNIKDPPETAFFSATIWCFIKSLQEKAAIKWLILSGVFFGLALGTKFNILFIGFILIPHLLLRFRKELITGYRLNKALLKYPVGLLLAGVISLLIFFGTWPFLWHNFPGNLLKITSYYKEIGMGLRYQTDSFFIHGFNTFPIQWVIFTTPPLILCLTLLGILSVIKNWIGKNSLGVLFLLWLLVPIVRVTIPNTVIYGGDRQIMEFIPAMAILSGVGAWQILEWVSRLNFKKLKVRQLRIVVNIFLIVLFIWPLVMLVKLHPSENVYFNFLIGGLKGAREKNFPSWGNTFGSVYRQGIDWINQHAEQGSKLALIQGEEVNAPLEYVRGDINYSNRNFSGINREGEYLMEFTFNDTAKDFYYKWEYINTFLKPIYEVKADGVPILKIWKNDLNHTFDNKRLTEEKYNGSTYVQKDDKRLSITLGQVETISNLIINFNTIDCVINNNGFIETSVNSNHWEREKDNLPALQMHNRSNIQDGEISFYFAGKRIQRVRVTFSDKNSCALNPKKIEVLVLN